MRFIDWNGNGRIDPVDIGISIALENGEENEEPPSKEQSDLWKLHGLCYYCGGKLSFFGNKCKYCGRVSQF
jgi:hypothetical protein